MARSVEEGTRMRAGLRFFVRAAWPLLLALWAGGAQAERDEPWQHLDAPQIRMLMADAQLRASDRHYRFTPDGGVLLNSRRTPGRWHIERDELCFGTSDSALGECYEVQRRATRLRLLQDGYLVMEGELRPKRAAR